MKVFIALLFFHFYLFASSVHVAVAANVSYAIKALVAEFHNKHPDIKVEVSTASSGKLTAQIKNYAPYEIFLSANMFYPNELYKSGYAITQPKVYAKGSLALLSVDPRDLKQGVYVLKSKDIHRIAIANPKTAPYGIAAKEALENAKLYKVLYPKFIFGDSIATTLIYTMKAADIGIIAKSALFSPQMKHFKKGINFVDVDKKLYNPIKQGIVMLKTAQNNAHAALFYDFLLSDDAKKIFREYGYIVDE
jgi:molybdate transport system substrate-binding protein